MRKTYFIFLIMFFGTSSCIKKEQKVSETGEVSKLLNEDRPEEALAKVDQLISKNPDNAELKILKASALSMSAGVDIYALYPILKDRIFNVAIEQWDTQRNIERGLKKRAKMDDGEQLTEYVEEFQQELESIKNEPGKIEFEFTSFSLNVQKYKKKYENELHEENRVTIGFSLKTNLKYQFHKDDNSNNELKLFLFSLNSEDKDLADALVDILNEYEFNSYGYFDGKLSPERINTISQYKELQVFVRGKIIEAYEEKFNKASKDNSEEDILKGLSTMWKSSEYLPVLTKLPFLDKESHEKLREAQNLLVDVRNQYAQNHEDYYLKRAGQQLFLISIIKYASWLKKNTPVGKITKPTDVFCLLDETFANEFVESKKEISYLIAGIDDEKLKSKYLNVFNNLQKNLDRINQEIKEASESTEKISFLKDLLNKQKQENCQ